MKSFQPKLQRLLKAAAAAPKETPGAPPFGLETRVLAHWRSGAAGEDFTPLATIFHRAAICAATILVASAGWTWFENRQDASGAMALANYTITIQLKP